ncbi:MAG: AMP-binding protein [Prevotellaceae bacterium]|nr:AMP-binding protein [Prevotellaceae bacterium]
MQVRTLQQLLQRSVTQYAERNALSFVDGSFITYREFSDTIENVQAMLCGLGIKPGDKVAVLSHNMPNWGIAYFAIATMGAVVIPLLPDFSATEVENVLNHSESKAIFVSQRLKSKVDELFINSLEIKIELDNFFVYQSACLNESETTETVYTVKPDDLAAIVYTSGTTGKSKGVMLTHANLLAQLDMVNIIQKVWEDDIFLSILPLSHMYECSLGFLTPINNGASIYYLEKPPTVSILLPALKKIRPTYMCSVPMIIEKIYRNSVLPTIKKNPVTRTLYKIPFTRKMIHRSAAKKLNETFGGRLKFFGIGGAKLDSTVELFLYEGKVFPYAIGYGLTETAPLITAATPRIVKHQSTGFALPEVELTINNPNPATGEGEIWAKGANVMQGYYKEPEMTAEVLTFDGWLKTGDLGVFDRNGRLFIKGRLKNVILGSSGENIYPEEIESVINNFKYVNDSLVLEQEGKLVAMVRFNYEELEKQFQQFKEEFKQNLGLKRQELEQRIEQLKMELLMYVNSRVNRFSQISLVVALQNDFEKTSTQKIKRYLYA